MFIIKLTKESGDKLWRVQSSDLTREIGTVTKVAAGRNFGNRAYFPSQIRGLDAPQLIAAFLGQFYDKHPPPRHDVVADVYHKIDQGKRR